MSPRALATTCVLALAVYFIISEDLSPDPDVPPFQRTADSHLSMEKSGSEVVVCTQNMFRLAEKDRFKDPVTVKQLKYLVARIKKAKCDIIALQEVSGKNAKESSEILTRFVNEIALSFGSEQSDFEIVLGYTNDHFIRNATVYRKSSVTALSVEQWAGETLSSFWKDGSRYSYARGPLAILFQAADGTRLFVVNDHLKSKSRGYKDPSGTKFELVRIASAAAIKERILRFRRAGQLEVVEIFLGDRNTSETGASVGLMRGEYVLDDFKTGGRCLVSSEGSALCSPKKSPGEKKPEIMIPLLEESNRKRTVPLYTYKHGRHKSILDEIYMSPEDTWLVTDGIGRLQVGTEGELRKGSDHLLAWVRLSLNRPD